MSVPRPGCEVVRTRTGALAMLDHASGEVMHPLVGPTREAEQLYVLPSRLAGRLRAHAPAMRTSGESPIVVLDVGLGAGSNALAARRCLRSLEPPQRALRIVSFERDLGAFDLAMTEAHAEAFGFDASARTAGEALLRDGVHHEPGLVWELRVGDLATTLPREPAGLADVVFWDPFSPRANPSLWTVSTLVELRRLCGPGATVHTYSGATATRTAFLLAGFHVGFGEPTGEKAQTTIASVDLEDLERPLDARFLARLRRSSAPFPADAPADALSRIEALPQFLL